MKMSESSIAFCLSAGLLASAPGISFADVNHVPQNTSDAPAIPSAALQRLTWAPVDQSKAQTTQLLTGNQQLNVPGISGPVAVYSIPTNIDKLTPTPISEMNEQTSVFVPNVLVLDQNMILSAFLPSSYFTYQEPGVMSAGRPEGVMRLAPALGQRKLYVLVSTTKKDFQQTTQLLDPTKACAKGIDGSIPGIPDPIAHHTTGDSLKLKAKTNSSSSVSVGPLSGSSALAPVMVGNMAVPAVATPVPTPVKKSESMLNNVESYFNTVIRNVVVKGDVDKALRPLDKAERLESISARSTFISSVGGKGWLRPTVLIL